MNSMGRFFQAEEDPGSVLLRLASSFLNRFWSTEEGVDSFGLFLELSQIGSGIRQMPWPSPTAKDGLGDIHLCPAHVTYRADQAGRIVETTHRLVILGTESP